jgi:hypothetical protein
MSRTTILFAMLALVVTPWVAAQQTQPNPQVPEDAFTTRQLIAWSGLQKPQPTPQPLPPSDTAVPQPDQPSDQQANPPGGHGEQTPAESFTGKIIRDDDRYCLRSGSITYQVSEQAGLQKYENQSVQVIGNLDSGIATIRILKIELL